MAEVPKSAEERREVRSGLLRQVKAAGLAGRHVEVERVMLEHLDFSTRCRLHDALQQRNRPRAVVEAADPEDLEEEIAWLEEAVRTTGASLKKLAAEAAAEALTLAANDVQSGAAATSNSAREPGLVTHAGSCHCGAVRFEFDAGRDLVAWECDCSICSMKRNTHAIVPEGRFRLLAGNDHLSCYQFNTHTARHLFCKTCGICPFYRPRSNPDGYAVTVHCLRPGTVRSITMKHIAGSNWESVVAASGIQQLSSVDG